MASGHYETRKVVKGEDAYGRPIYDYIRVWVADPVAPVKTSAPLVKAPAPVKVVAPAPQPAPTVYTFNGRRYTSYKAYTTAITSYRRAQAEASARLAEQARQRRIASQERERKRLAAIRTADTRRRERERLEAERARAYAALQERVRKIREARLSQQQRRDEAYALSKAQRAQLVEYSDDGGPGFNKGWQSEADKRREQLTKQATQTGNWDEVIQVVRDEQVKTGGRFVDRKLLDRAMTTIQKEGEAARTAVDSLVARWNALLEAGDVAGAQKLVNSEATQAVLEEFYRLFGQGRKPGLLQRAAEINNQIASDYDKWFERQIIGPRSGELLDGAQLTKAVGEFREQNLTVDRRGGAQEFGEFGRAISINEWLRRQANMEQATLLDRWRQANLLVQRSRHEGLSIGVDEEGRPVYFDRQASHDWQTAQSILQRAGADDVVKRRKIEELMNLLSGSSVEHDRAVRELLAIAEEQWKAENKDRLFNAARIEGGPPGARDRSREDEAVERFRRWFFSVLNNGAELPGGPLGGLYNLTGMPVVGTGIEALGWGVGGVGSGLRLAVAALTGGGRLRLPDLDVTAPFRGEWGSIVDWPGVIDTSAEAKAETGSDLEDLFRAIGNPDANILDRINQVSRFGQNWAEGNTSLVAETVFDPVGLLPVSRFLKAGRLASIRQGGLRQALAMPGATARDFLHLVAPGRRDAANVEELIRRMDLAREVGRSFDDVANLTDQEITELIEGTINLSADQARKQGIWRRLFESDPVNAQQLFAAVSPNAQQLLSKYGRVVDPMKLEQSLRAVDVAVEQAEREAKAVAARQARVAREAKLAQAVDTVRAEIPAPAPRVTALSVAQRAQRGRLVRDYISSVQERVAAARKAADLGKVLRESHDFAEQSKAFDDFEPLVQRLEQLNDKWVSGPTGMTKADGIVSRRRAALEEFDARFKVTPRARAHDIGLQRIDSDITYVQSRINQLMTDRRTALPSQLKGIDDELKRYYAARDGLRIEREVLRTSRTQARRVAKRFAQDLTKLVSLNRVAPRAVTQEESTLWLLRDLRGRGLHATRSPAHLPLAPQDARFLADLEQALSTQVSRAFLKDLADLIREFGDVSMLDLWYALKASGYKSAEVQAWLASMDTALQVLWASRTGRRVSHRAMEAQLVGLLERRMLDVGTMGWSGYRKADKLVADNLEKVRGFRAAGQVRVGKNADPAKTVRPHRDSNFADIYAKLAALRDAGTSFEAYEMARSVMRNPMLRFEAGNGIRARAQRLGTRVGATPEEAFDRVREARRMQEVRRNIEEITMRPGMAGLSDDELFSAISAQYIHDDLRPFVDQELTAFQAEQLESAYRELAGHGLDSAEAAKHLRTAGPLPPFGNRQAMRDWMVDNGHWAPRTADDIRAGGRVLSIDDERRFWETNFGYSPEWTDPKRLETAVHSKESFDDFMRQQGVLNDDFERLLSQQHLTVEQVREQILFGGADVKRARTYAEIRSWVMARFGDVASTDGKTLRAFPWLMDARSGEYRAWLDEVVQDNGRLAQAGVELDLDLIKPGQRARLAVAVDQASQRAIDRLVKLGDIEPGQNFLPQQFNAFAYDVVDHLLADPVWRNFLQRRSLGARVLDNVAAFWRALVSWTPAFINMNLIDAFGLKRVMLTVMENGWRPLSRVSARAKELIPDVERFGISRESVWMVSGRNGFRNAFDTQLSTFKRAQEAARGVTELPLRASKKGEDMLRLDYARSAFDREVARLRGIGWTDDALIERRALAHARLRVDAWFPQMGNSSIERLINQLVPFFSYNTRLKLLGIKIAVEHPWVALTMQRLGEYAEAVNREVWAQEHPDGEPFPEDDPRSGWLWVKIGDQTYAVDLGGYSDWVRGLDVVFESHTPVGWVGEFFRLPHPSQQIFLARAFGLFDGKTPWGTEARWEDVSLWFDFTSWLMKGGQSVFDPNDPKSRDAIQVFSQMLFFKGFSRINPMTAKVQQFFAFMDLDPDQAWAYYNANPDLAAYFQMTGHDRFNPRGLPVRISWFSGASTEDKAEYQSALDGYEKLRDSLDAKLDEFYLRPWDPEYRKWKSYRRGLLRDYVRDNPLLGEVWGFWMAPAEWARELDEWQTDELMDAFFAMDDTRPVPADFKTELEFQTALAGWIDMRQAWLEAHPTVGERLYYSRNAVERAWFDHQLQWMEILDQQADVRIRLLTEEAKGASADRELISLLYDLSDVNYSRLDAESFGEFYDLMNRQIEDGESLIRRAGLPSLVSDFMGRIKQVVTFPGRADFFYEQASPAEKREIEADEVYFEGIGKFMEGLKDPRQFWTELEKNPALLAEYLKRNPDKRVDFAYVKGIQAVFAKGGYKRFWDNLVARPKLLAEYLKRNPQARAKYERYLTGRRYFTEIQRLFKSSKGAEDFFNGLEANPWLRDQYYARHPEKRGNSRYFQKITALFRGSSDAASFFAGLDADPWLKREYFRRNPDKAASYSAGKEYFGYMQRWVKALQAGNFELGQQIWDAMPAWVHERYFEAHPDNVGQDGVRTSGRATAEYVASLGRWVELLKRKDYEAADKYFRALPEWMRERYFTKHPDQRARFELTGQMLSAAAHYLVASDGDRIGILERNPALREWLREHGGKETVYRGLIMAAYRNLPKSEAWLRRVFREKYPEVFGQEAAGERRRGRVSKALAENPELHPFYDRALQINSLAYVAQLRRSGALPKPLVRERKRRLRRRARNRRARYASHWSKHREYRLSLRRE